MRSRHANADSLAEVLESVWNEWQFANVERDHPFRLGILATRNADGVSQRTLVLRDSDRSQCTLTAFTDRRSRKVREIEEHPEVSWLFLDPGAMVQIRVEGTVAAHFDDEIADAGWAAAPAVSKFNYLEVLPPGTAIDSPTTNLPAYVERLALPASDPERAPPDDLFQPGRENFCVLITTIHQIEWLRIDDDRGHRRCRFVFNAATQKFDGTWLTP